MCSPCGPQPPSGSQPNLGALLIAHFHRQSKQTTGDIRIGGLVTHIAEHFLINLGELRPVPGPTMLTRKIKISSHFLVPDDTHGGDHSYKCPLPQDQTVPVLLPLLQAFQVSTRQEWVLTLDQINEARHGASFGGNAQDEPAPEWDAAAAAAAAACLLSENMQSFIDYWSSAGHTSAAPSSSSARQSHFEWPRDASHGSHR